MVSPGQRRADAHSALIWEALDAFLGDGPRRVLDMGGGAGALAVRCAASGHEVTLIDPSPDAVAAAHRRAEEQGVGDRLISAVGDLESTVDLARGLFDLVICHDVLGVVPDPEAALARLCSLLSPGGVLSVLVALRPAAVQALVVNGQVQQALDVMAGRPAVGPRRFDSAEILSMVERAGLQIVKTQGVRIFVDAAPASVLDSDAADYGRLMELERQAAARPEFAAWAARLHVVAQCHE